jgi:hypothetical protein
MRLTKTMPAKSIVIPINCRNSDTLNLGGFCGNYKRHREITSGTLSAAQNTPVEIVVANQIFLLLADFGNRTRRSLQLLNLLTNIRN